MKAEFRKIHLGCGTIAPPDWINIDSSWNAWLAKYPVLRKFIQMTGIINRDLLNIPWPKNILIFNITKNLPFQENSIDYIYSSHSLEHLYLEQAKKLLHECYRILKPKGTIRIVVPDLKSLVTEYLSSKPRVLNDGFNTNADRLISKLHFKQPAPRFSNFFFDFYQILNDTDSHKWMYDVQSLTFYLKKAGFINIKTKKLFQSKISNIRKVEQPIRLENAICLEAEK